MSTSVIFLFGAFLGLLVEAIVVWVYLRKHSKNIQKQLKEYENKNLSITKKQLALKAKNEALREEIETLKNAKPANGANDKLEDIKGIGPVFARRLNNAGIKTFEELVKVPTGELEKIVEAKTWQDINPEQWIWEAKQFLR